MSKHVSTEDVLLLESGLRKAAMDGVCEPDLLRESANALLTMATRLAAIREAAR